MDITALAILALFPLCMIFATFYDLFTMTIPNKITLALVVGFFVIAPFVGMSIETILASTAVAAAVLVGGFALFAINAMGGGDAKLLAASSLWFGTALTLPYIFLAGILGGLLTFIFLIMRRFPLPPRFITVGWLYRLFDNKNGVPYGIALGPAALLIFADSPWMDFITKGVPLS